MLIAPLAMLIADCPPTMAAGPGCVLVKVTVMQ